IGFLTLDARFLRAFASSIYGMAIKFFSKAMAIKPALVSSREVIRSVANFIKWLLFEFFAINKHTYEFQFCLVCPFAGYYSLYLLVKQRFSQYKNQNFQQTQIISNPQGFLLHHIGHYHLPSHNNHQVSLLLTFHRRQNTFPENNF